jgi:hypothetical protein
MTLNSYYCHVSRDYPAFAFGAMLVHSVANLAC